MRRSLEHAKRQPAANPRVRWSNPITAGLRAAIIPVLGYDAVNGVFAATRTTSGTLGKAKAAGLVPKFGTSVSDVVAFAHHPNYAILGEMSIVALVQSDAGSSYGGIIAAKQATSTTAGFELRVSNGGGDWAPMFLRANGTTYSFWVSSTSFTQGGTDGCLFGVSAPATIESAPAFYGDGVGATATSHTGGATGAQTDNGSSQLRLGLRYDSAVYLLGWHGLLLMWDRILTPTEHRSLAVNPWQVFEPSLQQGVYAFAPAVGGSFQPAWAAAANAVISNGARAA